MHKFLIVGHPQSGYQEVADLLHDCGMGRARASRREGLLPEEISRMLCEAHGTGDAGVLDDEAAVQQIGSAPVWHGMALDLMLGNLGQRFWGWADPNAIYLLDYWKQLDPSINFIFVYAGPDDALLAGGTSGEDDASLIDQRLRNWQAFNGAMLHFYNRNSDRSVLVHADQVRMSVDAYLAQLRTRLNAPVERPPAHRLSLAANIETAEIGVGPISPRALPCDRVDPLDRYVVAQLIAEQPAARALYEELQAVATLPLRRGAESAGSVQNAWRAWCAHKRQSAAREDALLERDSALDDARLHLEELSAGRIDLEVQLEQRVQAIRDAEGQLAALATEHAALSRKHAQDCKEQEARARSVDEEYELIFGQLQRVQEAYEQQHQRALVIEQEKNALASEATAQKHALAQGADRLKAAEQALSEQRAARDSTTAERDDIKKKLLAATAENESLKRQSEALVGQLAGAKAALVSLRAMHDKAVGADTESANRLQVEINALQEQLRRMQDELAQGQAQRQELEQTIQSLRADLPRKEDALLQVIAGIKANVGAAAASARRELGEARQRAESLRQQRDAEREVGIQQAAAREKLIRDLGDANTHLKGRLDSLQGDFTRLLQENRRLDALLNPPPPTGALARVKRELPYRLGSVMVTESRSLRGLLRMPWTLAAERRAYEQEEAGDSASQPALATYRDAEEGERARQHLSYRLGSAWLKYAKSPAGWLVLLFALARQLHEFRKQQRGVAR